MLKWSAVKRFVGYPNNFFNYVTKSTHAGISKSLLMFFVKNTIFDILFTQGSNFVILISFVPL
jgi:hypothetical protein